MSTSSRKVKSSSSKSQPSSTLKSAAAPKPRKATKSPGGYKITFGHHKGKPIRDIPLPYIEWFVDSGALLSRTKLRTEISILYPYMGVQSLDERDDALKRRLPAWIYTECMDALSKGLDYRISGQNASEVRDMRKKKLRIMEELVEEGRFLDQYQTPRAENTSLPDPTTSNSVAALKRELDLFPKVQGRGSEPTQEGWEEFIELEEDFMGNTGYWTLREPYKKRLENCLEDIRAEHGVKVEHLARWEIKK